MLLVRKRCGGRKEIGRLSTPSSAYKRESMREYEPLYLGGGRRASRKEKAKKGR